MLAYRVIHHSEPPLGRKNGPPHQATGGMSGFKQISLYPVVALTLTTVLMGIFAAFYSFDSLELQCLDVCVKMEPKSLSEENYLPAHR